ncbi:MAG: peptidogalycan biosysnthesis protein, partial [Methyloceanibacter sp.]
MVQRIAAVPASEWDACARCDDSRGSAARPDNPFISHAFLHALEESGSATRVPAVTSLPGFCSTSNSIHSPRYG